MKNLDYHCELALLKRRRLIDVALSIHVIFVISGFFLTDRIIGVNEFMLLGATFVTISAVLAFIASYKSLETRSVIIFSVGSLFPILGILLIILLRERLIKKLLIPSAKNVAEQVAASDR